jgi:protein-export membrane protein SecD/preprotein translocase SecF subunit
MGEKNLWSKVGLIVLLVGLSIWQLYPPGERLKPGIDLGGGYSVLLEIDDSTDKSPDLAERVMSVLKQRIDPQGQRNLVWRPIGRNRLEIQMPRPNKEQLQLRDEYREAREALLATNITEAQIRAALALPPEERNAALEKLIAPVPAAQLATLSKTDAKLAEAVDSISTRGPLVEKLISLDDQYRQAAAALDTRPATTQPATAPTRTDLGKLIVDRTNAIQALLRTNLNVAVLVDVLDMGNRNPERAAKLADIVKQHPDLETAIALMTERYDLWSKHKGALDDPADLLRLLRGAGVLEFRILALKDPSNPEMLTSTKPQYNEPVAKYVEQLQKRGPRPEAGDNYGWFKVAKPEENSITQYTMYVVEEYLGTQYVLAHSTKDMGLLNDRTWSLRAAYPGRDDQGRLAVHFELDTRGGDRFYTMTSENIEQPLSIFLDNEAISAATIRSAISTSGQISGNFTPAEVQYLVSTLEAGALPAKLKETPLQEKNVGPSLGETNRTKGMYAVIASLIAVVIFMAVYYAYNGAIADIALMMNLVLTLGIMSFLQATFTLPGIAGLILTLGMAVDANVLIFERMREELQRGVSARMAVKLGYEKAFSAILDGNVTTIITAVILGWIGSEEIKGFGLTLGIGLTISMFTALFVTRQYYNVMVPAMLNRDEVRKAWMLPVILAVSGGAIAGLGYLFNRTPEAREDSTLLGLGQFLMVMFATALVIMASLWAFRGVYKATGHQRANRLPMMKLMSAPNIDWMSRYRKFWIGSAVVIVAGLLFMAGLPADQVMDIEFIGGTNVQVQPTEKFATLSDEQLQSQYIVGEDRSKAEGWLHFASNQLANATVTSADIGTFQVTTPEKLTAAQMEALLLAPPALGERIARDGVRPTAEGVLVQFRPLGEKAILPELNEVQQLVKVEAAQYAGRAADKIRNARIQTLEEETATGEVRKAFDIITTETARTLVAEAIMESMGGILESKQPIEATLVTAVDGAPDGIFPIRQGDNTLSDVISQDRAGSAAIGGTQIGQFKGGLVILFDNLNPPATELEIEQRLRDMRLQPDFEATGWRTSNVIGLEPAGGTGDNATFKKVAIAVVDPNLLFDQDKPSETWRAQVAERELALAKEALASSQSLQRVTQFAPQVASEAAQRAIIAVMLSLIAIAGYLWVRFGSLDFGLAGIIALYHDVAIALTAVVACHYLAGTWLGDLLMLQDFKIDLNIVAALLTIVGFSINDTIVIFDRIRENRGRLGQISPALVNDSLNQTLSRTVLTALTLFIVVLIMYVAGGEGIHGFAFAMIIGTISGTYSTLAIATPMVLRPRAMYITTIFIAASTMIAMTFLIDNAVIRYTFMAIIGAGALYGMVRQYLAAKAAQAELHPHRPVTA